MQLYARESNVQLFSHTSHLSYCDDIVSNTNRATGVIQIRANC